MGVVAAIVGIAFADSSIVVLALPQLYGRFHASIEGVSWVLTAYNVAVAVAALALVLFVHRLDAKYVLASGLVLFLAAFVCAAVASAVWDFQSPWRGSRPANHFHCDGHPDEDYIAARSDEDGRGGEQ